MNGGGLERLVSSGAHSMMQVVTNHEDKLTNHIMMQTNESLYIGEFDLEPLQMTTQIQLPDMEALRY